MTEKNKKKLEDKKRRNLWQFNPVTRCKGDDKKYNRKKIKEAFRKEDLF